MDKITVGISLVMICILSVFLMYAIVNHITDGPIKVDKIRVTKAKVIMTETAENLNLKNISMLCKAYFDTVICTVSHGGSDMKRVDDFSCIDDEPFCILSNGKL